MIYQVEIIIISEVIKVMGFCPVLQYLTINHAKHYTTLLSLIEPIFVYKDAQCQLFFLVTKAD